MKKFLVIFLLFLLSVNLFADDDEKLKLAVMDFEDLSGKFSDDILSGASEYFRVTFAQTNRYIIISKDHQKDQISDMRKTYNTDPSYKSCTDKNCQIQLGQALSADLIVKTSISFFAGFYTLASELIDLEKEATIIAATEEYDGSAKELRAAIKKLVDKIVEAEKRENDDTNERAIQAEQARLEAEKVELELRKIEEESHKMIEQQKMSKEIEWSISYRENLTWNNAQQYCENLYENGHDDWRLPTIDEWRSTFRNCPETQPGGKCQVSETNGRLTQKAFSRTCKAGCRKGYSTQTGKGWFWSSSGKQGTNHFWVIALKAARISSLSNNRKGSVKCVR